MGFEIDFLPVGDGEKGGDTIALRYGKLDGSRSEQVLIVIDGGTKESGEDLVKHIIKYYKTEHVDKVISTHPDADHSSGLTVILEKLKVDCLWMHRPWEHAQVIKDAFKNGRITGKGLKESIKKSLENAYELETIAKRKEIPIFEPFSDLSKKDDQLIILGPSEEFYEDLLPNFRETPEPKEAVSWPEKLVILVKEVVKWIAETWGMETLTDPEEGETSAENNSSTILLLPLNEKKFLFTSDAGTEALNNAINKAESLGIDLREVGFFQIPHHGSKHNVGPTILNHIIGEKLQEQKHLKTAFVSAPKDGDPKHPSRKVINALKRRGAEAYTTKGIPICHRSPDAPDRGWHKAEPLPFYEQVAE